VVRRAGILALRWGVAASALALLVALGNVPIGDAPRDAMIRFVGRMVGEKVRVCRDLTAEELAKIPKHMQAAGQRCEQSILPYHLEVWIDEVRSIDMTVSPAGIRGDRPVYVHRDLTLAPGTHQLRVRFEPEALQPAAQAPPGAAAPSTQQPATQPPTAQQDAVREAVRQGTRYPLERTLTLRAGMIVFVELNEQTGKWDVRGDGL
jgi:hypothetical protein